MKIISAGDVRELLPMDECITLMSDAMRAASNGEVAVPPRLMMPLIDASGHFCLMPGSTLEPPVYGAKIIGLHPANPAAGRPTVQGFVTLFDHASGAPLAIIEGSELTAIRTAAASGLATAQLAREDARSHGVFGTGVQAISHIDAIAVARPIERVVIWGRDATKARTLATAQAKWTGLDVVATDKPQQAAACDIVTTVTAASEPILHGAWLNPGTHVNLVGAHAATTREADSELIANALVYTDLLESLFNESGDVLIPLNEGRFDRNHVQGEIGQVVSGRLAGRRDTTQITVYKSLGITAQDLYAAHYVYQRALASGTGSDVAL